ncbi:MAG: hypothetical protein LC781_16295, partial [Actinobacteria bacterium]|nr:hypothetical protein [Actinomycetota bacterium]
LRGKAERIAEMERDRDAILESYAGAAPEALDSLTPEERRHVYGMLKVRAVAMPDGRIVVSGAFVGEPLGEPLAEPSPDPGVCLSAASSSRCTCRCSRSSS